jgi:hypothetical protein
MSICDKCQLKTKKINSILDFPFKLYETKSKMKKDLFKFINNNEQFLFELNPKYNSNILHELIYKLVKNTYNDKLYKKQHIWGLEILSILPEFPYMASHKNCKNEIPLETYIRLVEDRGSDDYHTIIQLLLKNDINNIKIIKEKEKNINVENSTILIENDFTNDLHPEIPFITQQYHNLQRKLFKYLEENYACCLRKCEMCNSTIDIFNDFEKIGIEARKDKHKKILIKNIEHIISLRRKGVHLSPMNDINKRHEHIITYFLELRDQIGD